MPELPGTSKMESLTTIVTAFSYASDLIETF